MSFDLSLARGDLTVGGDGDLNKVRNSRKVVQDVLKVLHTPLGSNPFFPRLGNALTTLNIGENLNTQFMESRVETSVTQSIQILQSLQRQQELIQTVTAEERIANLSNLEATRDEQEPRQFNINIAVLTGAGTAVQIEPFQLSLSTTISGERTL